MFFLLIFSRLFYDIFKQLKKLLKREGKIRFIGLSNFNKTQIEDALKISKIDCVQAQFSLLKQDVKNMFEFLESNDICFMAYGVLGGGLLSGKYKKVPQLAKTDVKNFCYRSPRI